MEFKLQYCPVIESVSDRILNINKIHGDYAAVTARGGNEQKILILVAELFKLLNEKGILTLNKTYDPVHTKKLRNLTVFLIVNTNLTLKYDLNQDPHISSCLNKCTRLTKCILMNLIWALNLEDFLYEFIALTPHWLSLELLDAAKSNIEYLEPFDFIDKIQRLIEVLYHQITRMQFVKMPDGERQATLSSFFRVFAHFLQLFIKPPPDKMSSWTKRKLMKYTGYCMRNAFEMTIRCLKKYLTVPKKKLAKQLSIYNIKIEDDPYKCTESITKNENYHPTIKKTLTLINTNLFDACAANIKSITMEIYLYWAEIDDEISPEDTLQTTISTLAYELQELMKTHEDFQHGLKDLLPNFARKPKSINEKIREADLETIIKYCSLKSDNQKAWFDKLIDCNDLLKNPDLMECLKKNIHLMDGDNMPVVLGKAMEFLTQTSISTEERESLKSLMLLGLKNVRSVESQIRVVQGFFINNGVTNILQTSSFEDELLQVFNRTIVMDNYKLQQILSLVVQNPEKVYRKAIETSFNNSKQVDMMTDMLKHYNSIGNVRFETLKYEVKDSPAHKIVENLFLTTFLNVFDETKIDEISNFVKFIQNINGTVMETEKLLSKFLVPKIQNTLVEKDFDKLYCLLCGLDGICTDVYFGQLHAPIMVVLAQVLEFCRWDLLTFQCIKVQIVNTAVRSIEKLGKEFYKTKNISEKAVKWLQMKLSVLKPLNKMHFNSLWLTDTSCKNLEWKPIMIEEQKELSRKETISYLCERLSRMVMSETRLLTNINDPYIICDTMLAITAVVEDHLNSESALGLLSHCYKLASCLLKDIVPLEDNHNNIILFSKLLEILTKIPLKIRENCCLSIISILTSLLNEIITNGISEDLENDIQSKILKLNCKEPESVLIKMLFILKQMEEDSEIQEKSEIQDSEMEEQVSVKQIVNKIESQIIPMDSNEIAENQT